MRNFVIYFSDGERARCTTPDCVPVSNDEAYAESMANGRDWSIYYEEGGER